SHLHSAIEVQGRIRELIKLAKEQGYLTFDDLNEALPEGITDADELDLILTRLRRMEIDIIEASEVDRYKDGKKDGEEEEEEEEKAEAKLDTLDDPVRMYLKQMGQVPLLTREQEVEISKRIESAEYELKRIMYSLGFAAKEHIALAEKLVSEPPKERFDRVIVDKKIEGRDNHLKDLRKLIRTVRNLDQQVDQKYAECKNNPAKSRRSSQSTRFKKLDKKLQEAFGKFYYKQKVVEEMALVAENIHDKFQLS